jgi:hypothetical protein
MPPRVIGRHFPSRRVLSGSFLLHLFLRNSLKSEPDGGRFAAERRCMRRNEAACTDRPSTVTVPSGRIQSGAFDDDGGHARLRSRFVSFAGLPKTASPARIGTLSDASPRTRPLPDTTRNS